MTEPIDESPQNGGSSRSLLIVALVAFALITLAAIAFIFLVVIPGSDSEPEPEATVVPTIDAPLTIPIEDTPTAETGALDDIWQRIQDEGRIVVGAAAVAVSPVSKVEVSRSYWMRSMRANHR